MNGDKAVRVAVLPFHLICATAHLHVVGVGVVNVNNPLARADRE